MQKCTINKNEEKADANTCVFLCVRVVFEKNHKRKRVAD